MSSAVQDAIQADTLRYAVTGTLDENAIKAGMNLLDQGGSAVDAALSVALSQITTLGGKYVSFAGIFNMVYYEATTGRIYNLNASFNTVQQETEPWGIPFVDYNLPHQDTVTNGRTVLVPGFMKGVGAAHARFGKLPLEKIFEHAISLAERGVPWTRGDDYAFTLCKKILTKYPETKAVFTKEDGSFYKIGDNFKQLRLAQTLKAVAKRGTDDMYTGLWAKKFVKTVREAGGKMTMEDMKNYEVIWSEPVHGTYHQYDIYTPGAPALGGSWLLEKLNIIESSALFESRPDLQSPETLYRLYLIGTYPFDNAVSFDSSIITKAHAERRWNQIAIEKGVSVKRQTGYHNEHTAAVVVTDRWGNMAVVLHTINTVNWGSNGLFVEGVSIPDPASGQQQRLIHIQSGSRLPDGLCPGIVFKDRRPIMGFGCVGGGLINQSAFSLVKVLDYGMTPQQANDGPNIGRAYFTYYKVKSRIKPKKFSDQATELGGSFKERKFFSDSSWSGVARNYRTMDVKVETKFPDYDMTPQQADGELAVEPGKFSDEALRKARELGGKFKEENSVNSSFWSAILRNYETGEVKVTRPIIKKS